MEKVRPNSFKNLQSLYLDVEVKSSIMKEYKNGKPNDVDVLLATCREGMGSHVLQS